MNIAFIGHCDTFDNEQIENKMFSIIDSYAKGDDVTFYLRECGGFDIMANKSCQRYQGIYGNAKRVLIMPYVRRLFKIRQQQMLRSYDDLYVMENEPESKYTLNSERDKWIVNNSDLIIGVENKYHILDGSTLDYARDRNIEYVVIGNFV